MGHDHPVSPWLNHTRWRGLLLPAVTLTLLCMAPRPQGCPPPPPLRVATFNIRNYPESAEQERGAFALLRQLGVAAVAVQEIRDPAAFAEAARAHLGSRWRFVYPERGPEQRVGVLFDEGVLALQGTWTYQDTVVYPEAKPTFVARLWPRDRRPALLLAVVHLKAGGDQVAVRRQQLAGLQRTLAQAWRDAGGAARLLLMGDFNTTSSEDRRGLKVLAAGSSLIWASEKLACTSYWERGERCEGTALDHVLVAGAPQGIAARGPCESEGCGARETCPLFHRQVSDHCPVVTDL